MATVEAENGTQQVGEIAGVVWHCLKDQGPLSAAKLAKEIEAPRDIVMQAVGWLAREGKVAFEDGARTRTIRLA